MARSHGTLGPVALLTDFGLEDPYVGVMHGVLARFAPEARVIDLAHGVPPQRIEVAALWLARTRRHFPAGTIFVAVVDPGVGSARRVLAAEDGGQRFLAPDNGLLAPVLSRSARVHAVDVERHVPGERSATFHGRDVFCPLAARLARGDLDVGDLGPAAGAIVALGPDAPRRRGGVLRGTVLFADRFGNLVTNLEPAALGADPRAWRATLAGRELPWVGTYADARPGEPSLLVNSYGLLEVAVASGSAAEVLGTSTGAVLELAPAGPGRSAARRRRQAAVRPAPRARRTRQER